MNYGFSWRKDCNYWRHGHGFGSSFLLRRQYDKLFQLHLHDRNEELDRIERAILFTATTVSKLDSALPEKVVKDIKDIGLDVDFILEKLDAMVGNEFIKQRRRSSEEPFR